ncbi:MAG: ornithine cyclodeaminase family protein [Chloroflexota bacterium]
MSTLLLGKSQVKDLLQMSAVIEAVENAFGDLANGQAAMPAALPGAVGVKWVSVYTQNLSYGLPTVIGTLIYNDPETGYPLAIMDATELTAFRTGATAAIASKYLARKDSHTLGLIGAGRQSYTQILAHAELYDITLVKVFDVNAAATERLIKSFPQYPVQAVTVEEAAASDIVCTVTPAREPVLKREHVLPGTHINAVGADAEGKEELEPSILKEAMVIVDDIRQASLAGEINVPISKGLYRPEEVYATLGDIIIAKKPGRKDNKAITIFDATGVAIEDIAVARLLYEQAKKKGGYQTVELV